MTSASTPLAHTPSPLNIGRSTDPVRVEGQAADGSDALAHETIVVLDVVDQLAVSIVDGSELVHGAAAGRWYRGSGCQASAHFRVGQRMGPEAEDQRDRDRAGMAGRALDSGNSNLLLVAFT